MERLRRIYDFFRESVREFLDDNASDRAAALAFLSAFSVAPMLLIATAIAGFVFGQRAAEGTLSDQLEATVGPEGAGFIESMVAQADNVGAGIVATLIGMGALVWGASRVFAALQRTLDEFWKVEEEEESGWKDSLRDRLRTFAMVFGVGLFLIALLLGSVVVSAMTSLWEEVLPAPPLVFDALNYGVIFVLLTGAFGLLFRYLPRADLAWRDVWVGAALTSVLFVVGAWLVGLYMTQGTMTSIFGAAGAFALVLLWVYYMAQIFLFGAEMTKVYARKFGKRAQSLEGRQSRKSWDDSAASPA